MAFGPLPATTALRNAGVPLLMLAAAKDILFPASELQDAAARMAADFSLVPEIGHGMMLEPHWESAAATLLEWLAACGVYQR
ncbi:MAG: hypothetical protein U5L11_06205 [Arhodomonas sp.]|nr:hypothetical protein [Arhodomonas sp.]